MPKRSGDDEDIVPNEQPPNKRSKKAPEPWDYPSFEPLQLDPEVPNFGCPAASVHDFKHPYDVFKAFFTNQWIGYLCAATNRYATQCLRTQNEALEHPRPWKPVCNDEMEAYLGVILYIGLESDRKPIQEYWDIGAELSTHHAIINSISLVRWEQINRYFQPPGPPETGTQAPKDAFPAASKVWALSSHLQEVSKQLWVLGRHLAIDETIAAFEGRAKETVQIPSKPTPEGFKLWILGDHGYQYRWLFHAKGTQKGQGPQGLSPTWKQWPKTTQVVLQLLEDAQVVPGRCCVWLDNLFSSEPLFRYLRQREIGAAGTVRTVNTAREEEEAENSILGALLGASGTHGSTQAPTEPASTQGSTQAPASTQGSTQKKKKGTQDEVINRGITPRIARLKSLAGAIEWGTQYVDTQSDGQVLQIAFRDQVVVLFFTTVHRCTQEKGLEMVLRTRKRPNNQNTKAKAPFGASTTKVLPFPVALDDYNHFMGAVDLGDQLETYFEPAFRLFKHWKALFRWLLMTTITNCWVLWDRKGTQNRRKHNHRWFLREIALRLLKPVKGKEFRKRIELQEAVNNTPGTQHTQGRLSKKGYCVVCRSRGSTRSALQSIEPNTVNGGRKRPPQSNFGCLGCNKHLCSSRDCFTRHLEAISNM